MKQWSTGVEEVLQGEYYAYLATVDKDNQPHVVPVFFVYEGDRMIFYIMSSPSKKVSNITENPIVSLVIDRRDPVNPFNNRGIMVQGLAEFYSFEESSDDRIEPELTNIFQLFDEKYPAFNTRREVGLNAESEIILRIVAKKAIYWEGPFFKPIPIPALP